MSAQVSLQDLTLAAGARFIPYGHAAPEERGTSDEGAGNGLIQIAADFGQYEAEYAAIRRHVGVIHLPQRGILRFTGGDRQDFLHRMMTQDIRGMTGGRTRRAFQLNDKGRIIADAVIHHGEIDTWLELDLFDIPALHQLLDSRLFAEDVTIEDWTHERTALALQGPAAQALLQAVADDGQDVSPPVNMPGTHHVLSLAGRKVTVYRWDDCGVLGLRLLPREEDATELYEKLLEAAGYEANAEPGAEFGERRRQSLRGRPIGWLAYNTARIEAGSPIFHIDFGTDSLPGETGLLNQAVCFTKGCYIGQEIVARIKNLGHPRRMLVGLKFRDEQLPVAGAAIFPGETASIEGAPGTPSEGKDIGAVTSSTVSPILGNTAIALATMKWGKHQPGVKVAAQAGGHLVEGVVQKLGFLGSE